MSKHNSTIRIEAGTAAGAVPSHDDGPLIVSYLTSAELASRGADLVSRTLGAVGFGAQCPPALPLDCPFVRIEMPQLSVEPLYEVWTAGRPVFYEEADGFTAAISDEILFGSLKIPETGGLESQTYDAYLRLFEFIEDRGYRNLLRVWNYLPDINGRADGMERYHQFNLGRHEAFVSNRRRIEISPAACAVGTQAGPTGIYFLASRSAARPIENPRQISAYSYPVQYGPRSPVFSRGMVGNFEGKMLLFISGTASILGHESMHPEDPQAQARETVLNIQSLLAEAAKQGLRLKPDGLRLKVYVRRISDLPVIRDTIAQFFDSRRIVYIHADICRSELLLEIEGVAVGS